MPIPIAAVLGAIQVGTGVYQTLKANSQAKALSRPQYTIPKEVQENLTAAQMRALEGLPEAQKKEFVQNVQRASSNAVNAASDRRSGLVGIAGAQQTEIDAYTKLLGSDAAAKQQNELQVMKERQNMADYKERAWETNQMQPYLEKRQQAQGMQAAGMQNVFGGLNQGLNILAQQQHAGNVSNALGMGSQAAQTGAAAATPAFSAQPSSINMVQPNISNVPLNQYGSIGSTPQPPQMNINPNGTLVGTPDNGTGSIDPVGVALNQFSGYGEGYNFGFPNQFNK